MDFPPIKNHRFSLAPFNPHLHKSCPPLNPVDIMDWTHACQNDTWQCWGGAEVAYQYDVAAPLVPAAPKKEHRTFQLAGAQPDTWQCTPGGKGRGGVEEEGEGDRDIVAVHKNGFRISLQAIDVSGGWVWGIYTDCGDHGFRSRCWTYTWGLMDGIVETFGMDNEIVDFVSLPEPNEIGEDMHPSPIPKLHDPQRFVQPPHHLDLHQNWEDCGGARWHIVIARETGAAESVPCMCR